MPPGQRGGARERLLDATIDLMRERGVHGAGLTDLLQRSGAARGSVYQHFPDGKGSLVAEATRRAGRYVDERVVAAVHDPHAWVDAVADHWTTRLPAERFTRGCPIAAASLAGDGEECVTAAEEVYTRWCDALARLLRAAGVTGDDAASLASFAVSAVQGAVMQSVGLHATTPLDAVRRHLHALFTHHGIPEESGVQFGPAVAGSTNSVDGT